MEERKKQRFFHCARKRREESRKSQTPIKIMMHDDKGNI
jgi:hypothetical protein